MTRAEEDTKEAIEAANRWTDNIYQLKSWCVQKGIDGEQFEQTFDVVGLDYIPDE
jgi:hypothetical protein